MDARRKRIVFMTSGAARHRYVADVLCRAFDVAGIASEAKRPAPPGSEESVDPIMQDHLAGRDAAEERFFGSFAAFPGAEEDILRIEAGRGNDQDTVAWVRDRAPDALVLFGSSIIREPLLSLFPERIINLHLGLSPYYRGTATNFWPLAYREPECTGATVHLAVRKVDAGGILVQARPDIAEDDGCHEIGCKALIAGVGVLPKAIDAFLSGSIRPQIQDITKGKVFTRADFSLAALMKMRAHFASGMIPEYLADKEARDRRYPITDFS